MAYRCPVCGDFVFFHTCNCQVGRNMPRTASEVLDRMQERVERGQYVNPGDMLAAIREALAEKRGKRR